MAAANLQALLGFSARIQAPWPVPVYAHLPARSQYDAGPILKTMAQGLPPFQVRLGITVLDLCLPILSYVYGEALLGGRLAVASLSFQTDCRPPGLSMQKIPNQLFPIQPWNGPEYIFNSPTPCGGHPSTSGPFQ